MFSAWATGGKTCSGESPSSKASSYSPSLPPLPGLPPPFVGRSGVPGLTA